MHVIEKKAGKKGSPNEENRKANKNDPFNRHAKQEFRSMERERWEYDADPLQIIFNWHANRPLAPAEQKADKGTKQKQ